MNLKKPNSLSALLKQARADRRLSARGLAAVTGVEDSTIIRIEQGAIANPRPDVLKSIADALDLDLADVYTAAGYVQPKNFPSFNPYLRSRYAHLPKAARAELEESFGRIAQKYGYSPDGPTDGEDETN